MILYKQFFPAKVQSNFNRLDKNRTRKLNWRSNQFNKMLPTSYDKEAKLWRGPDFLPRYDPKLSLGEALFGALNTYGSKIAQVYRTHS